MSAASSQVKKVLVVTYEHQPYEDVKGALAYLGEGVSVERAASLGGGASLTGRPFDAVVIATTSRMRLEHYGTLISLVRAFSGRKSTVFVIGPRGDGQFVTEMIAAGGRYPVN